MTSRSLADTPLLGQIGIKNRILGDLTSAAFSFLRPHLFQVDLKEGDVLQEKDGPIEYVDFIESGLISFQALGASNGFQVAMAGRRGMIGMSVLLGETTPAHRAVVAVAGKALRIYAEDLKVLISDQKQIEECLLRHVYPLLIHGAQSALCAVHHPVARRLASWFCLACEELDEAVVPVTAEQLSKMLGGGEIEVMEALAHLEQLQSIRKIIGGFEIQDRRLLLREACDCYEIVTAAFRSALQRR